jgi:hypothetical protein
MRRNPFVRSGIMAAAIAALAFFFIRSVQDTRAEAYTVPGEYLSGWTLALERSSEPSAPRLTLQPPQPLTPDLFRQVFTRTMESMSTPSPPGIPLVLQQEIQGMPAARAGEAIIMAAREAGLETAALNPRCMAFRRTSVPGATRQAYFLLFDLPEFGRFRERLKELLAEAGASGGFDPNALSPVMIVSASDARFTAWYPLRADAAADCVAPVTIE